MPFTVKNKKELELIREGDKIHFELNVSDKESWIEKIDIVLR